MSMFLRYMLIKGCGLHDGSINLINEIIQNMFKKNNFSRECPKAAKKLTENGSHLEFLINT